MATTAPTKTFQFKLVLLGESAVGKSSLVLRFVRGQFFDYQESTIGAAFLTQTVALNDTTVKFEIWDTAGQERYHSLAPMYYRGAAAAIVVYDITSPDSFARAKSWVRELQRQGNPNIVIALAGNKSDLASKRKVDPDEAKQYAEENSIMFMETSAKTAANVNELFVQIGSKFGAAIVIVHPGLGSLQRFMLMQLVDALLLAARKLPKQQAESKPAASQVKLTDPATAPKTSGCNTNC